MKKTTALFVFVGMFFMNTDTYGWNKAGFVRTATESDEIDARPFAEYIAEADTAGQNYGQLMQIIGGENFKDSFQKDFDENWRTAVSLTKELSNDDKYKLLGLRWCETTRWLQINKDKDRLLNLKFDKADCKKNCETTYAEWVSDVLYSATFYAYNAFSEASNEYSNNCWRGRYCRSLNKIHYKEHYGKLRNYWFDGRARREHRGGINIDEYIK